VAFCVVAFSLNNVLAQDQNSFDRVVSLSSPWFVDFGDINGDAIMDMVGVYGNSSSDIKIFHGKSDGTFELKTTLPGGTTEYYAVFLQQLNSDNIPDIVAVSGISGIVYLSGPTGYTTASITISSPSFNTNATLFADFNEDNILDLFFGSHVLLNNGSGSFTDKGSLSGNGGATAIDFDNDDFQDIVLTHPGGGKIYFYKGNGDGTFDSPLEKTYTAHEVIAYDLNADGFKDIVAKGYDGEIAVLMNDDTFTFPTISTFNLNHNFYSTLRVLDLDLNGTMDLVTSNDNHIQYRPINSDGTFGNEKTFNVGMGSLRGLIYKDAIGESFSDLVVMSGSGSTKIYSDKLNTVLQFTTTQKVYDGSAITNFYSTTPTALTNVVFTGLTEAPKNVGTYEATVAVNDPAYEGSSIQGTVTINKKTLTVDVSDVTVMQTKQFPAFELQYSGFANTEEKSVLTQQPVATTTATPDNDPGEYTISISGGVDENYSFNYLTGVLTITELVLGVAEDIEVDVFPNPATDHISINHPQWRSARLYSTTGQNILTQDYSDKPISVSGCSPGVYVLQVSLNNGNIIQQKFFIK
jgi:hypothetical protein